MTKLKVLIAAGLVSLTFIQAGFAGHDEHCDRHAKPGMHPPKGPMMDKYNPMTHLLKRLDLSEQQDKQIKQIFEAERSKMQSKHEAKMALMQDLHEVVSQQKFNEQQAKALAEKIGELEAKAAMQKAKTGNKVYVLLTPEQQAKFKLFAKEKMQKRSMRQKSARFSGVKQAEKM